MRQALLLSLLLAGCTVQVMPVPTPGKSPLPAAAASATPVPTPVPSATTGLTRYLDATFSAMLAPWVKATVDGVLVVGNNSTNPYLLFTSGDFSLTLYTISPEAGRRYDVAGSADQLPLNNVISAVYKDLRAKGGSVTVRDVPEHGSDGPLTLLIDGLDFGSFTMTGELATPVRNF